MADVHEREKIAKGRRRANRSARNIALKTNIELKKVLGRHFKLLSNRQIVDSPGVRAYKETVVRR